MLVNTFLFTTIVYSKVIIAHNNTRNDELEELEKQKGELFQQINHAIDESILSLIKANDTEAAIGLEYMRDLKEHVKELNYTDKDDGGDVGVEADSKSDLENRRAFKGLAFYKKKIKAKDDPFDFESILKPKKISAKDWKEMLENRIQMQKKLDDWLLERKKEKDRLEKYRLGKKWLALSGKYEKCPRFGYEGKKKRVKDEKTRKEKQCKNIFIGSMNEEYKKCISTIKDAATTVDDEYRGRRNRQTAKKYKYPCCRKCCKKSYMGCL